MGNSGQLFSFAAEEDEGAEETTVAGSVAAASAAVAAGAAARPAAGDATGAEAGAPTSDAASCKLDGEVEVNKLPSSAFTDLFPLCLPCSRFGFRLLDATEVAA
ncbi:hypothetical protein EPH_0032760 [Eimeria praecox]|uniref:Uncharacterized protein n=1 Tax=Eimeria praecox TaxID=51316 RepID=U6G488_9EIME|nr:hypothetical protein EPH_0032760 [Eimeria praecox]